MVRGKVTYFHGAFFLLKQTVVRLPASQNSTVVIYQPLSRWQPHDFSGIFFFVNLR